MKLNLKDSIINNSNEKLTFTLIVKPNHKISRTGAFLTKKDPTFLYKNLIKFRDQF